MDIDLRRAGPGDQDALSLISAATFLETYHDTVPAEDLIAHCQAGLSAATYTDWIADPAYALWLAEVAETHSPVAYLALTPPDLPTIETDARDIEVRRIYALSATQGAGLGRRMMEAAIDEARTRGMKRVLLGVYKQNAPALAFYERMGFEIIGMRMMEFKTNSFADHILALGV